MKNVTVYSTPNCQYCKMTKEFLGQNNIPFSEVDVAADAAKRAEMIEISEQMGVPVTVIDDQVIVGFDRDSIKMALGIA